MHKTYFTILTSSIFLACCKTISSHGTCRNSKVEERKVRVNTARSQLVNKPTRFAGKTFDYACFPILVHRYYEFTIDDFHQGIKNVGWEPSWFRQNSQYHWLYCTIGCISTLTHNPDFIYRLDYASIYYHVLIACSRMFCCQISSTASCMTHPVLGC